MLVKFEDGGVVIVLLVLIFISNLLVGSSVIVSPLDGNGNLEVAIQDQFSETIDLFLTRFLNNVTLAQDVVVDSYNFLALAGHNISVNNFVCFKENKSFLQVRVTGVNGNNISIDSPFDFAYSTDAYVCNSDRNLNVVGSDVNPVVFRVTPVNLNNVSWDINWVMFHMMDNVVMDDDTFGGIPKLSNGVVVRVVDGYMKNLFNVRYNGDFAHHMKVVEYVDKAPSGLYAFRSYKTFNGLDFNGVVVRLDSEEGGEFQVIVRDDLSDLTTFHVSVHGSVVVE